jgi:hypothetical protein
MEGGLMNKVDLEAVQQAVAEINPPSDIKIVRALQYANEWLKYGEAKHAVLITLNGATLTALNNLVKPEIGSSYPMKGGFWCATVVCVVSILVSLYSFYARVVPEQELKLDRNTQTAMDMDNASFLKKAVAMTMKPNLVFFGHLAQRTPAQVLEALVGRYDPKTDCGYLKDMAEQVVINSRLALQKAKLFNLALSVYILSALVLIGLLIAVPLWPIIAARLFTS